MKRTTTTTPHRKRMPLMLLLAAGLHGVLLMVGWPERPRQSPPALAVDWIRLAVPEPDPPGIPEPETALEPPRPAPQPETLPSPIDQAPEAVATEPESRPEPGPESEVPRPAAAVLRQRVLIAAAASVPATEPRDPGISGAPAPRLPDAPGWLNDYVGTVRPGAESWQEADGSTSSRVVLAGGQVLCGRQRAPSMDEIFNPWMSAAVTTWRACGRERPAPVDRSDPWVRGVGVK